MNVYLVGGAVRDTLLDIPFTERDWVVTGATPEQMLAEGFRYKDPDGAFPVFLHPDTGEEYALARRETKTGAGYRGFAIDAGPDVTLEEDLARRDLTINAMAQDSAGNLIDPFGGRDDLDSGLLRHVTPAFTEDPVRLLRIARFAAKLGQYGFRVAHGTHALMKRMATDADLKALQPARVWAEWRRSLGEAQPWRFIEVLQRCDALPQVLPELADALGEAAGHGDRAVAAPIAALQRAVAEGLLPPWRMACLLAAVPGDAAGLLERLPVDKTHAEPTRLLYSLLPAYRALPDGDAGAWLAFLEKARAWRDPEGFQQLVRACRLSAPETPANVAEQLLAALSAATAVDAGALMAGGLDGAALGQALRQARLAAVAEACGRPV